MATTIKDFSAKTYLNTIASKKLNDFSTMSINDLDTCKELLDKINAEFNSVYDSKIDERISNLKNQLAELEKLKENK